MRRMKIYAAGGAGCNIGAALLQATRKRDDHGFAEIEIVFIDTSRSNLNATIPASQTFLFENLDGSGKLRASNYNVINEHCREILLAHKPADVNIVLSSGGGGSGSVIAPVLVSELLAREELVIAICVGSTSSRIETENTLKSLRSYEMISQKRGMPVITAYRENSQERTRAYVDQEIQALILILAAVFSGNNRELDMSDLRNFINYNKVTGYQPKLAYLDVCNRNITIGKGQALVTLVTLVDDTTSSDVGVLAEYQAVGYVPEASRETLGQELPLHVAVISGYFNSVVERLETKISAYEEGRKAVIERSIVTRDISSTDDGIVL